MKTTLEIPDDLFRQTKAKAALRGESLKDFVNDAIRSRLALEGEDAGGSAGWRRVFGKATREQVAEIDAWIAEEFGRIDIETWR